MINLTAIIILYNQQIDKTVSLRSLSVLDCKLIFFDNSTDSTLQLYNRNYCIKNNYTYCSLGSNVGLSKAYNYVIQRSILKGTSFFMISDQDTEYNASVKKIPDILNQLPNFDLYVPIIKDCKGILSPTKIRGKKFYHHKTKNFANNISFINSGIIVKSTVFNDITYNENLFLDFVDHDFYKQFFLSTKTFYIMNNVELYQNFSGVEKRNIQSDFERFKIFLNDGIVYYSKWYSSSFFKYSALFERTLKLTIIHKSLVFLKYFFKRFFI